MRHSMSKREYKIVTSNRSRDTFLCPLPTCALPQRTLVEANIGYVGELTESAHSVTQVGVCSVLLVEPVLPLHHHAQMLVIHDEALDVQLLYEDGGQLLAVHEEAAIAINVYDHLQYIKLKC